VTYKSNQPKLKGKSYNVISLAVDDDITIMTSLGSYDEEKSAFTASPATSPQIGTRSDKQRRYTRHTMRHIIQQYHEPLHLSRHQPCHWTNKSRRNSILINS